jgi:hypothetical protein
MKKKGSPLAAAKRTSGRMPASLDFHSVVKRQSMRPLKVL